GNKSGDHPLAGDGRPIEYELFLRADGRERQEFLQPHGAAPGHDNSKKKKDQPEIPRHRLMRTFSRQSVQGVPKAKFLSGVEQEGRGMTIIEAEYSEVWFDRFRETHGDGQGGRLRGQAESRDAGCNTSAPATANGSERARWV